MNESRFRGDDCKRANVVSVGNAVKTRHTLISFPVGIFSQELPTCLPINSTEYVQYEELLTNEGKFLV